MNGLFVNVGYFDGRLLMSRSASGESNDGKEDREEAAADKLGGKVTLGDLIWVKVGKDTWWPAQV